MTTDDMIKAMYEDMQVVKTDLQTVKTDLETVKHKVTIMELSVENEIRPNIMRVAEGHLDLYRNISDVKSTVEKMNGKMEMYDLYIRHHDSEIKKLQLVRL